MQTETKRTRRTFDEPFKRDTVALMERSTKPLSHLARELGVCPKTLRDWKAQFGQPTPPRSPEALEAELRALRRENQSLRAQRDILKKTLGILSEPPNNVTNGSRQ